MRITSLSIQKSITVFVLMIAVILMGASAYKSLPREANPDIKIPFVMVYAPYFGTSPEDMENLVTRKLEKELKGLSDLVEMSSTSSEGVSSVVLEFKAETEMSDALQKVRDAIELAKPELPQDVREDMIVYELSSEEWPIMQVVLSGDYDPVLLKETGEDIQEELEQIKGVLGVDLTGGVEREVRIDVDPDRLRYYGIALQDLKDAVFFENVTLPGGELAIGSYEYQVRVPGEFQSVDEIQDVLLNPGMPTPVYMRDVASVSLGLKDRETISRKNQVDSVTLSVKKRSGENIVRIADEVRAVLAELEPNLPPGTSLTVTSDQSDYVRDMVSELENNIISGLILVVAVLFLFLGLTNSIFVGVAIPFSMLITFMVLQALDMTLNMVVLFSLILALGMLVDNAVVIVENIFRHRTEGYGREEAAARGTHQVTSAVIASSLTTICAFAPLVFWPGLMGEFMKYLPITVIISLAASLLVALVFNPVLCAKFMRVPKRKPEGQKPRLGDRMMNFGLRTYDPVLRWSLRTVQPKGARGFWKAPFPYVRDLLLFRRRDHRLLTLWGMTIAFVVVLAFFAKFNAGIELFPDTEPQYAYVKVEAPSGTRIEVSDSYARQIEQEVDVMDDLVAYVTEVGAGQDDMGGSAQAPPHLSLISMEFLKMEQRSTSSRQALEDLRERLSGFTGAQIIVDKQEDGPPTGAPINIEISGKDFATLGDLSDQIKRQIRGVPGLVNLQDDFDRGRPEIQIRPDLDKAARYGLRRNDIASTILTAIRGEEISEYRVGEDEYDIVVRYALPARQSVEDLETMTVHYEGQDVALSAFAEVSYEAGFGSIKRLDSRRVVTVTADVGAGFNGNAVLAAVQANLGELQLPTGYRIDYTGESEDQEEAGVFLGNAFRIALTLIFLVLVTEFASVTVPFVIMTSVVFSLMGVFLGLMTTRTPFGIIMTGVGVISLAGIVVNNAIVLLDYILQLRRSGMAKAEAIIEAGKTRFRPVLLTAITTILGLIPLTTGISLDFGRLFSSDAANALVIGGESSQWWGPMGVAVIWGLAVATFLTLVVVPVTYSVIDSFAEVMRKLFHAQTFRAKSEAAAAGGSAGGGK